MVIGLPRCDYRSQPPGSFRPSFIHATQRIIPQRELCAGVASDCLRIGCGHISLDDAALAVGASKRTLARKVQSVLGMTPLSYFQGIRVEQAVHLLKTTSKNVDEVAEEVGYADGTTLRTLLRKRLGHGIKSIKGGHTV